MAHTLYFPQALVYLVGLLTEDLFGGLGKGGVTLSTSSCLGQLAHLVGAQQDYL
jgi:hypothetical protein